MNRRLAFVTLFLSFAFFGCGQKPSAKVSGKVTCNNKPVKGSITFSPLGEGEDNTGPAGTAPLKDDGTYEVELKSIGKHRVVVNPSDIVYPAPPGKEYPCDLTPQEKELKAGKNTFDIELPHRGN